MLLSASNVQLKLHQYWFRSWIGAKQVIRHYLKLWWSTWQTHTCHAPLSFDDSKISARFLHCDVGGGIVFNRFLHYNDVIMGAIASQITSLTIVTQSFIQMQIKKHQSPVSLAFVRGIHWVPVNSPHKWPVTWKMFPSDDVIMMLVVSQNVC